MQDLINMVQVSKCQEHQQPLERICIKVECTHKYRGLCRLCPKLDDVSEVNLFNLFNFIEEQDQQSRNKDDYRAKALLFQQFKRQRMLIEYHLDQIQAVIESAFQNISESFISKLNSWAWAQARQVDSQALGELLSRTVQTSQDQKIILKSNQVQTKFNGAIDLVEDMKSIRQLSINFQKKQEQLNKQQQNQVYKKYQISKTVNANDQCKRLCFNHDETQIAVVVKPNKIQLFNDQSQQGNWIIDGEPLIGHFEDIWQVQFNHNSTQLVSCDMKGLIIVYRKQLDGKWTIQDKLQRDWSVNSICFNHNSTQMASGGKENIIQIYEFVNDKWKEQQILTEHKNSILMLCFNNNSTLLASGSGDKSIIIWELNNIQKWVIKQKLTGHTNGIHVISFNIESTQIVSGGYDYLVKVWSVDKEGIWGCSYTLTGHTGLVMSVWFNQQSNMIVSNSQDESLKIWVINQQNIWECAQTIQNNYQRRCGIIINKKNQIFKIQEKQILIYDQTVD